MDTIVVFFKPKRYLRYVLLFSSLFLLTACPSDDDCFDMASTTRVNDLISLLPEKEQYNIGDTLTLRVNISATNAFFGNEVNLYQQTGDNHARLTMSSELFESNVLVFRAGKQGEFNNWFDLHYNTDSKNYELEIEITLNRSGQYSFTSDDSIEFDGGGCNRFRLDSNILWSEYGIIEFTVIE